MYLCNWSVAFQDSWNTTVTKEYEMEDLVQNMNYVQAQKY